MSKKEKKNKIGARSFFSQRERPCDNNSATEGDTKTFDAAMSGSASGDSDGTADEKLARAEMRRARLRLKIQALPSQAMKMWKEYRRDATLHVREGSIGFALGICAYLLGSCNLLFDTFPLGLALLCAAPKKILWIFFGLCASAASMPEGALVYVFAYATAISVRILARLLIDIPAEASGSTYSPSTDRLSERANGIKRRARAVFTESIYLRMATGCASAFITGLYFLVSRGFVYYDLFAAIFSMLCTPVAVFVYSGCFEENDADARFRELALATLTVSLTFSLRNMTLVGISLGVYFAFFVTLYACRQKGIWKGALLGLLCGVAYSPAYAPMFAISGFIASMIWNVSAAWAMTAAGAAAMIWGFYAEGTAAVAHILPAVMLSAASYLGAQKLSFFPAARDLIFSGRYCVDMNDADIARISRRESEKHLETLSDTFESLSEIFYNLSDRLSRPGLPELRRMCDGVYDRYCPLCPNRDLCWEIEYASSAELLGILSEALRERGVADIDDLPEYMRSRCAALPGIIGEINRGCAELTRIACISDKTDVFAMDYAAVSELLADAAKMGRNDSRPDVALSEKLTEVLAKYGFGDGGVNVYGDRRKQIIARGFDISGTGGGMKELKASVETACGFDMSDPVIEIGDGSMTLKMSRARSLTASCVMRVNNTGQEECGDTVTHFENCDDKFFALISDGMGRGKEAAFTSGVCSVFLQKLLGGGNRSETVIKMLNNFIRSKPGECSATVDLAEVDLLNGHTEFMKCGASPSFVRRAGNLFKLSANTMPLGILGGSDASKLTFDAEAGDVIIMLSDGVAQGNDECMWLLDLLSSGFDSNLELMAEKIISAARRAGSEDDISVVLIKLDAAGRKRMRNAE